MTGSRRIALAMTATGALAATTAGAYVGLVTGRFSLDLGIGRRTRPLGPIRVEIAAPREQVYAVATAPYAERRPRAMAEKVEILERGEDMVLAAHHTPIASPLRHLDAVTVETVAFEPPETIKFRLVRGPVPLVTETFDLQPTPTGTQLTYTGELSTDLGALGARWGDLVTRSWLRAVETSLAAIKSESERRAH